jgi:Ca2+-binding EF-hand superfamily protein
MADRETIEAILNDRDKLREVTLGVFNQVDTDGSGRIDRAELKRAMALVASEAGLPHPSDQQVDSAMNALDTDKSGTLDVAEFQILIEEILKTLAGLTQQVEQEQEEEQQSA